MANVGKDFVVFGEAGYPKLLSGDYDPVLMLLVNSAFVTRKDVEGFQNLIKPYVEAEDGALLFDHLRSAELVKDIEQRKVFTGLSAFEIMPKGASRLHIDFLRNGGCDFSCVKLNEQSTFGLKNYKDAIGRTFDITFSNRLMHKDSGIHDDAHSDVFRSLEMYAVFANLTKAGGYSIHACGNFVTTLYETFLDFLGFRIVSYLKVSDEQPGFAIILRKYNSKEITLEEFENLYSMFKERNPARYT